MAYIFAVKSGNWSDTTVWDTGSIPTSSDVVYTNSYIVTIDSDVNVNQLRNGSNYGQVPNNAVPVMTSNTTPSGVASASFNNTTAFNAFNGVGWTTGNTTVPYTLTYQFNTPKIIKRFRIVAEYNASPNAFTFEGSNDGSTWTSLGSFTGVNAIPSYTISPLLANTTAYLYYRINVTSKYGASNSRIYNFDMTESSAVTNGSGTTTATLYSSGGYYNVASLPALPTQRTVTVSNATSGIVSTTSTVQTFQINATTGTLNINHATLGNIVGGSALIGSTYNIYVNTPANCTINVNGNLFGDTVSGGGSARSNAAFGIFGATNVNFIGNLTAGNMYYDGGNAFGSCAVVIGSTAGNATINVTGNLLGQQSSIGGAGSDAVYLIGNNATLNVTGNVTGGIFTAIRTGTTQTGNINIVTGTIQASTTYAGINNSGTGIVTLNSPMINTSNINSVFSSRIRFYSTAQVQWLFQNSAGGNTILYSAGASLGMPLTTNVRSGVVYGGNNELLGVLVMPSPSNVRIGVPTDNTIGTGQLTASDFLAAIAVSPDPVAERLRTVSTVDTTGDQIASFNV